MIAQSLSKLSVEARAFLLGILRALSYLIGNTFSFSTEILMLQFIMMYIAFMIQFYNTHKIKKKCKKRQNVTILINFNLEILRNV